MRVGGHTNTYHTRSAEEACAGIAAAGYRTVELTRRRAAGRSTSTSTPTRRELFAPPRALRPRADRALRRTPT